MDTIRSPSSIVWLFWSYLTKKRAVSLLSLNRMAISHIILAFREQPANLLFSQMIPTEMLTLLTGHVPIRNHAERLIIPLNDFRINSGE